MRGNGPFEISSRRSPENEDEEAAWSFIPLRALLGGGLSAVPIFSVQTAVLHRLTDVWSADDLAPIQVSDGAGHFQNPLIGPPGETHPLKSGFSVKVFSDPMDINFILTWSALQVIKF